MIPNKLLEFNFPGLIGPSTFDNEVLMWEFFERNMEECLSLYPTSLEEDIAILEADDK